jgi:uncharacterized protein (UPF0261 family)
MSADEMGFVATTAAERLNAYKQKKRVKIVIPLRGFSSLSESGGPLFDPVSDKAFEAALREHLDPEIDIIEVDAEINSREFAGAVVRAFLESWGG